MRIGIDARFLTHPQPGGFKTYTVNLIHALGQIDNENQYVLYLDRTPVEAALPQRGNFTYQIVDSTIPAVGMPIREQVKLRGQINRDRLDLVHFLCNTAPVHLSGKFIVTLHDVIQVTSAQRFSLRRNPGAHKRWAMTAYSKWSILETARFAERIITVSSFERAQIIQHLEIGPERICIARLGLNPVFAAASTDVRETWRTKVLEEYGIGRRFIMGVGYEPRKNIPLLIEAFSRLVPAHPDLDLVVIAAEQGQRRVFEELVAGQNLENRVTILKAVPATELAILYNLTDVFVFPSERESFGLPPLEALACGTPTIAMNMASLPEVLEDGAMLIDGKDVQVWANAIERVLSDSDLRLDLIQRGLRQSAKFTWQQCARETLQVYQDAVSGLRE